MRTVLLFGRWWNMSNQIFAVLNDDNICTAIAEYHQALDSPASHMISIESNDDSLLGKRWTGSAWEEVAITAEEAREWRDSELFRTDSLMLLDDYPQKDGLTAYRQELRDWPSTEAFPDTQPALGS